MADLIVYKNSYMTLEEANTIISSSFLSSSKEKQFWDNLSDDDKKILILNSTEIVDKPSFCYLGKKNSSEQNMEWPRVIHGQYTDTPYSIKKGLILQLISDNNVENNDTAEIDMLAGKGIKSFADGGGAKIEFDSSSSAFKNNSKNNLGILNKIWNIYFKNWSYIC